jgi:hypothetical protein
MGSVSWSYIKVQSEDEKEYAAVVGRELCQVLEMAVEDY